jgi:hypothetical protein
MTNNYVVQTIVYVIFIIGFAIYMTYDMIKRKNEK